MGGHKREKDERRSLERKLETVIAKLNAAKTVHEKLLRVQRAAQEQSEHIRRLQRRRADADELQRTIVSQEEVIEKLEEMLSWAHGTIKALQQKQENGDAATNRERELENEVIELQRENEQLRKQRRLDGGGGGSVVSNQLDMAQLHDDLRQERMRNEGLQKQLQLGAGQFGAQIADLKIQMQRMKRREADGDDDDVLSMPSDATGLDLSHISDMLDSISISTRDSTL